MSATPFASFGRSDCSASARARWLTVSANIRGGTEDIDVRAGAEHAPLGAADDHGADFRMLEADAVKGVAQLDVYAEVVGVEPQFIAGLDRRIFPDVERQGGHRAVEAETPML